MTSKDTASTGAAAQLRPAEVDFSLWADLEAAKAELTAWIRGERSNLNEQIAVESYRDDGEGPHPDRALTLVRTAQQDAASLEFAINRVKGAEILLRLSREA